MNEERYAKKVEKYDKMYSQPKRIPITLGGNPEDYDMHRAISEYLHIHGVTQKRAYLLGIASFIEKQGDNPRLLVDIANYIVEDAKRTAARRARTNKNRKYMRKTPLPMEPPEELVNDMVDFDILYGQLPEQLQPSILDEDFSNSSV
jgi:hypothetical protein